MGTQRVIFICGVCVMLGMYSGGLTTVDRKVELIAYSHSYQLQAEELSKTGVQFAINGMGTAKTMVSASDLPLFGGSISYETIDTGSDVARIVATGTFKGHQVTQIVDVQRTPGSGTAKKKRWNSWEVEQVFAQYGIEEYTQQYDNYQRYQ